MPDDYSFIKTCSSCGTQNRIPARHLADAGRCGRCKEELSPVDTPIAADKAAFESIIRESTVPVLVDFWAAWCGPCRSVAPEVEAVARRIAGKGLVLKVDTDKEPEIASRFRIQSIPNFILFRYGNLVLQQAGWTGRDQMLRWFDNTRTKAASV